MFNVKASYMHKPFRFEGFFGQCIKIGIDIQNPLKDVMLPVVKALTKMKFRYDPLVL